MTYANRPLEAQTEYLKRAIKMLGTKAAVARALGIDRTTMGWYAKGNLMKPHVAFKLNSLYEWAKCEKIHPDVWTKPMMDFQRKKWKG